MRELTRTLGRPFPINFAFPGAVHTVTSGETEEFQQDIEWAKLRVNRDIDPFLFFSFFSFFGKVARFFFDA